MMRPILNIANRPDMPAPVNAMADRLAELLDDELRTTDREVMRCALLTLAHRVQHEAR